MTEQAIKIRKGIEQERGNINLPPVEFRSHKFNGLMNVPAKTEINFTLDDGAFYFRTSNNGGIFSAIFGRTLLPSGNI